MNSQNLIAPTNYNMVSEFEKYAKDPEKLALIRENEAGSKKDITYANIIKNANKLGQIFKKSGLNKDDVSLLQGPHLMATYEAYIAVLKFSLHVTRTADMLRTPELEYRFDHEDVKAVIVYDPFVDKFEKVTNIDDLNKFV